MAKREARSEVVNHAFRGDDERPARPSRAGRSSLASSAGRITGPRPGGHFDNPVTVAAAGHPQALTNRSRARLRT